MDPGAGHRVAQISRAMMSASEGHDVGIFFYGDVTVGYGERERLAYDGLGSIRGFFSVC